MISITLEPSNTEFDISCGFASSNPLFFTPTARGR